MDRQYVIKSNVNGIKHNTLHLKYDPKRLKITENKEEVEIGAEKNKLVPTDVGIEIDHFLEDNFHYIVDKNFTALMENDLDSIADGDKKRLEVLSMFWDSFKKDLNATKAQPVAASSKKMLKTEEKTLQYGGKSYIIRIAKYGPVIQFEETGQKKYINIKSYLTLTKKEYLDINEEDIRFMTSLPKQVLKYKSKPVMLVSGPYGLYLKYEDKNLSITKGLTHNLLNSVSLTEKEMDEVIAYHLQKKKAPTESE